MVYLPPRCPQLAGQTLINALRTHMVTLEFGTTHSTTRRKQQQWPSLKSALRPPPSALAESANFRPFYVKRADFSPPPPATKKRRKLVKIRPCCPHLATKKRRKVVKIRPCGGWWVGGWFPPPLFL